MSDVPRLGDAVPENDRQIPAELAPLVYEELRKLAASIMAAEAPGHSLDATALVHEAYVRLAGDRQFFDRSHFFRVAAEAMRRILVDHARRKGRIRHGADYERVPLSDVEVAAAAAAEEVLALSEALDRFAAVDPVKAELVKLRYFAGLSEEEAAAALDISRATASRYWTYARAWLINVLDDKKAGNSALP